MPSPKTVSDIKENLLRPALTAHYEVKIGLPSGFDKVMNNAFGYSTGIHKEKLHLLCAEASLPGSQLATTEINNNFTGVTERHAYRRIFDDRLDLTFYVDAENYLPIRVFETWIAYITGEQYQNPGGNFVELAAPKSQNYFYRMRYPDSSPGYKGYTASGLKVIKFERDYNPDFNPMTLEYNFVKSFPISITSMPVTYNGSDLLRCSVGMTYIRYVVDRITGVQGPAPFRNVSITPTVIADANNLNESVIPNYGNTVPEGSFNITNSATSAKRQVEAQIHKDQSMYGDTWPAGSTSITKIPIRNRRGRIAGYKTK